MFPFRIKSRAATAAEKAAQSTLDALWGDKGFPVDPFWLAEQLGLKVLQGDLPENVSGKLIKHLGQEAVVLLSRADGRNRQRFSCAHELGHYSKRLTSPPRVDVENYTYVDFRDDRAKSGTDEDEIFANQFAAELLMPRAAIREMVRWEPSPLDAPAALATFFGVSPEALRYRLQNLGFLR